MPRRTAWLAVGSRGSPLRHRRARRALAWGVLTLVLLLLLGAPAQASLPEARAALERGDFRAAIAAARPLLAHGPEAEREARMILTEALVEMGSFPEALEILGPLAADVRVTPDDAGWIILLARALEGRGLVLDALDWWLTLAALPTPAARRAHAAIPRLLAHPLSQAERAYLLWKYPHRPELCPLLGDYADAARQAGYLQAAAWAAARRARCAPAGDSAGAIQASDPSRVVAADFFTIGVLTPLNGRYARYGVAFTNGIDAARRAHNRQARFPLRLEIADTGGDPLACLQAVRRLHEAGVRVFVGELFSLNTLMAAAYLTDRDAVLVSPAATDTTLRHIGAGTYVNQPGFIERAEALAAHAADSLAIGRIMLLWPETPAGRRRAATMRAACERRGVRVTLERSYPPGTSDFAPWLPSTLAQGSGFYEALFCDGEPRELAAILTEGAHQGFSGPYLGPPAFGEDVVAQVAAEYHLRLLYPGEAYAPVAADSAADFRTTYARLYGQAPDAFAARGWVAFEILARAIETGAYCAEALRAHMEALSAAAQERGAGRRLSVAPAVARPALMRFDGERPVEVLPRPSPSHAAQETAAPAGGSLSPRRGNETARRR